MRRVDWFIFGIFFFFNFCSFFFGYNGIYHFLYCRKYNPVKLLYIFTTCYNLKLLYFLIKKFIDGYIVHAKWYFFFFIMRFTIYLFFYIFKEKLLNTLGQLQMHTFSFYMNCESHDKIN